MRSNTGTFRSGKTDPVQFERGLERGLLRGKFALFLRQFSLLKVLCVRGDRVLAKMSSLQEKKADSAGSIHHVM